MGEDNTLLSSTAHHTAVCIAVQAKFGDCLHMESITIEHFPIIIDVKCTLVIKALHVQSLLPKK